MLVLAERGFLGTGLNYSDVTLSSLGPLNKDSMAALAQLPLQVEAYLAKGSTSNLWSLDPFRRKIDSSLGGMVDRSSLR